MRLLVAAILMLVQSPPLASSASQADPHSATERYAALMKEYEPASRALRAAESDLERKAAVEQLGAFRARFVALVEEDPKSGIALRSLQQAIQVVNSTDSAALITWEMNRSHFPVASEDDPTARLIELLKSDHLRSEALGPICERMRYGYRMSYESFLIAVLRDNPHRDVQALAVLSLAQFLEDRVRMLRLCEDRSELKQRYESVFGKDYLEGLQGRDSNAMASQIEALFERATVFDATPTPAGRTVAEQARAALYDMRHLTIGKVAPDIEGTDQEGQSFKLSEYRGRVVLLYFWLEF